MFTYQNSNIINHQHFFLSFIINSGVAANDIALMHLSKPLQFNKRVKPIELPKPDEKFTGNAVLSGWGVTINSPQATAARYLQKATINIINYNGKNTSLIY